MDSSRQRATPIAGDMLLNQMHQAVRALMNAARGLRPVDSLGKTARRRRTRLAQDVLSALLGLPVDLSLGHCKIHRKFIIRLGVQPLRTFGLNLSVLWEFTLSFLGPCWTVSPWTCIALASMGRAWGRPCRAPGCERRRGCPGSSTARPTSLGARHPVVGV